MSIFGLTFAAPLVLLGLLTLPVIWWLLRLTPPRPRQELFPPTRILEQVAKREETPAQSPWWLTLLRLLMATLLILALAEPVLNARNDGLSRDGSLLLIVDDGWASGADWEARLDTAQSLVRDAGQAERPVSLAFASEGAQVQLNAMAAQDVSRRLSAAEPKPIEASLLPLARRLAETQAGEYTSIVWISAGLQATGTAELADALARLSPEEVVIYDGEGAKTAVLTGVGNSPEALQVEVARAKGGVPRGLVTAFDLQGRSLSQAVFSFEEGARQSVARFELPVELRNEIARVEINGVPTAGAVQLLDERFRRRRVGLISGAKADQAQPLLSPLYYITRALAPFSDVREAEDANLINAVPQLIAEGATTLVLADIGTVPDEVRLKLEQWIEKGGMLVRFAGPRLASAQNDTLVPVELRRGGRSLGGTLTWGSAQQLTAFTEDSPFSGITIPPDVTVNRQVLAEPSIDLAERTWASLEDGTPLVTAAPRGSGWIVLFHVTADATWSNLPLSGAFVDMLRRIVAVSNGAIAAERARTDASGQAASSGDRAGEPVALPPLRSLSGFGRLVQPGPNTRPLLVDGDTGAEKPSLDSPPGLYGTTDAFVALNLFSDPVDLKPLDMGLFPATAQKRDLTRGEPTLLKPWLFAAALFLLALDCLAILWMAGAFRRRGAAATAAIGIALLIASPETVSAQQNADVAFENTLRTRLAFVRTGLSRVDEVSRKGLSGLTRFISSRTSLEPAEPVGVDISQDELAFFPLLYWPIDANSPIPDAATMARVDAFMKKGGSVLFDTRDQFSGGFGGGVTPATQRLREILASLDVPPLEPVPERHVLTRAFYLLNVFPGRYLDGQLWVETSAVEDEESDRPARQGDGVSSILITSNDLAGAWAVENDGSPSLPIVPANPTQRIYAYRTGVNIVMYTLTGNYKSDQVHIPALLERLGQ